MTDTHTRNISKELGCHFWIAIFVIATLRKQSGETPLHRCLFNNFDEPPPSSEYVRMRWQRPTTSTSKPPSIAPTPPLLSAVSSSSKTASSNHHNRDHHPYQTTSGSATTTGTMTTTTMRRGVSHRGRLMSCLLRFGADIHIPNNTNESVRRRRLVVGPAPVIARSLHSICDAANVRCCITHARAAASM